MLSCLHWFRVRCDLSSPSWPFRGDRVEPSDPCRLTDGCQREGPCKGSLHKDTYQLRAFPLCVRCRVVCASCPAASTETTKARTASAIAVRKVLSGIESMLSAQEDDGYVYGAQFKSFPCFGDDATMREYLAVAGGDCQRLKLVPAAESLQLRKRR